MLTKAIVQIQNKQFRKIIDFSYTLPLAIAIELKIELKECA